MHSPVCKIEGRGEGREEEGKSWAAKPIDRLWWWDKPPWIFFFFLCDEGRGEEVGRKDSSFVQVHVRTYSRLPIVRQIWI